MDAIRILLEEVSAGHVPFDWRPDDKGNYVLVVDQRILVNLHENAANSEIDMYGSPGYLPAARSLFNSPAPWTVALPAIPSVPEAKAVLRICPDTGLVLVVLSVDRVSLHAVSFRAALSEYVRLHRAWSGMLRDEPLSGEMPASASLPALAAQLDLA